MTDQIHPALMAAGKMYQAIQNVLNAKAEGLGMAMAQLREIAAIYDNEICAGSGIPLRVAEGAPSYENMAKFMVKAAGVPWLWESAPDAVKAAWLCKAEAAAQLSPEAAGLRLVLHADDDAEPMAWDDDVAEAIQAARVLARQEKQAPEQDSDKDGDDGPLGRDLS